jgi:enoyl-CoA hydratase
MSEPTILFDRKGVAGVVTLNRPKALNALDILMLTEMRETLRRWHADPSVRAVILQGVGRAFCAGGDVKAVVARRGDAAFMDEVYRVEYEVDHLLHTFGRPVVPLLRGIVMGGGCGISMHASHRVVAEDLVLAMPETDIGFFPDVAGTRFLARCPDNIGLYMALTGARISAADAMDFGLAEAFVPADRHPALLERIAGEALADEAIAAVAVPTAKDLPRLEHRAEIAELFSGDSALAIVQRLERSSAEWARKIAEDLRRRCPFTLELTTLAVRRAAGHSVKDILARDFRISQHLMLKNDYFEGVRARLIDRDNNPAWMPARLEDVDRGEVEACFGPWSGREMWDPASTSSSL